LEEKGAEKAHLWEMKITKAIVAACGFLLLVCPWRSLSKPLARKSG